jgi:hydrogenase expression/formation protein HypE
LCAPPFAVRLRGMPRARESVGKLSPDELERLISPHLGAARAEVIVGPRVGTDAAIVKIGAGRVMSVTSDPLSLIPALGP